MTDLWTRLDDAFLYDIDGSLTNIGCEAAARGRELEALIDTTAQHWLGLQGEHPVQWEGAIDAAMLAGCNRIRELEAERDALKARVVELSGRQATPLIDQHGIEVGHACESYADLHRREVYVDESGTVWTPPTAWAYYQSCRERDALKAEVERWKGLAERAWAKTDATPEQLRTILKGPDNG